ncbi:MAG TPA: hypothetical protein PK559_01205 [Ignavibacteriaceae bacterium]|nr:hypothetical protein [Ignavibacteriaceae bacterium]
MSAGFVFQRENAGKLLQEIDSFSNNKLKLRIELQELLELTAYNSKFDEFENLIFTAKYIQGLMRVVKNAIENPEISNLKQIQTDLSQNIEKFYQQLRDVIANSDESLKYRYEKDFLELSSESFARLNSLMLDLEWTKMYFNSLKRVN